MVRNQEVWPWTQSMPRDEREKREYYLGKGQVRPMEGVAWERQNTYENDFFMCQLPSEVDAHTGGYEDDADERPRKVASRSIKQQLLRTIGTEVLVNRSLNKSVAVVQSDVQWFATSTSHTTVDTILKFFGVPEIWTLFFRRYLEAPLRMVDLDGESTNVRIRKVCVICSETPWGFFTDQSRIARCPYRAHISEAFWRAYYFHDGFGSKSGS